MEPNRSQALAYYTAHYKSGYPDVNVKTTAELARLNLDSWVAARRTENYTLAAEVLCGEGDPTSKFPCQRVTSIVKPFYDYDERVPIRPEASELRERLDRLNGLILAMLNAQPGAEHITADDIHVAQRHGIIYGATPDAPSEFKISFRFFVSGVRTTLSDIKASITKAGHAKLLDVSVYSKGRKMCCVFGMKGRSDRRVLLPMEDPLDPAFDPLRYIIQHTEEEWPMLEVGARPAKRARRILVQLYPQADAAAPAARADSQADQAADQAADDADEADDDEEDDGAVAEDEGFDSIAHLLRACGFVRPRATGAGRQIGDRHCMNFDADNRDCCPLCDGVHDNNMWYVKTIADRGIVVCNHSTDCISTDLFSSPPVDPFTRKLKLAPSRHADYAERYKAFIGNKLEFYLPGSVWMRFDTVKNAWAAVDTVTVTRDVSKFLEDVILKEQDKIRVFSAVAKERAYPGAEKTMLAYTLALEKAYTNIGTHVFKDHIVKELQQLCQQVESYDTNLDLLHFTDGVFDLSARNFRPTTPADRNSLTTGYALLSEKPGDRAAVDAFYEKLISCPRERRILQKLFGYSITGRTDMKRFTNMTDSRGGGNGKSVACGFLRDALGGYAAVTKKDFLYAGAHTSADGPQAHLVSMRGKRLLVFEELDPSKRFCTDLIKEYTGGVTVQISARPPYGKTMMLFPWTGKFIMAFNEGRSAKFDIADEAFLARMTVIPFRKKATLDPAEVNLLQGIFLADPNYTRDVLPTLLAGHMRWLLEGYYAQLEEPITDSNMPLSLLNFKLGMVLLASNAKDVLEDLLVETELATDVLDSDEVYTVFKQKVESDKLHDLKKVNRGPFAQSFKLFVMGGKGGPSCYRMVTDIANRKSKHTATGWKLKVNGNPFM